MANKIGRRTIIEFEAGMSRNNIEIGVAMRGGILEAMIELRNMCMLGNPIVNILVMFNMLILILPGYEITSNLGIIQVKKTWKMMRCPSQITS